MNIRQLSKARKQKHLSVFGANPQCDILPPKIIAQNQKIIDCILHLATNMRIINNTQYHWTTVNNFASVLKHKSFFGNDTLKEKDIEFTKNAFATDDRENGDSDVICLCPYLVDSLAFYDRALQEIKPGAIRLSIDVEKVNVEGKYNQFFKLFDLCSPDFCYKVRVDENLELDLFKSNKNKKLSLKIKYRLEGQSNEFTLDLGKHKNTMLFYGNLNAINRFCLLKFFEYIQQSGNKKAARGFIKFLSSQSEDEIKKILTISCQTLTIFSEFNYNHSLPLKEGMITNIHLVQNNTTFELPSMKEDAYIDALNEIINGCSQFIGVEQEILKKGNGYIYSTPQGAECFCDNVFLYGNCIDSRPANHDIYRLPNQDFTQVCASLFAATYYETRPGLAETAERPILKLVSDQRP